MLILRALAVALILALVVAAPVAAAKGGKNAAPAPDATIEATVSGTTITYTWTGADGGWLLIEDSCRRSYVSSGVGSGTFSEWASCAGDATVALLSASGAVLATDSFTV